MTLIEKFENVELNLSECIYESIGIEASKQCEQIAEEFAIDFAEWIWGNCFNIYNDRFLYKDDEYKTKELLKIYKKEKGL